MSYFIEICPFNVIFECKFNSSAVNSLLQLFSGGQKQGWSESNIETRQLLGHLKQFSIIGAESDLFGLSVFFLAFFAVSSSQFTAMSSAECSLCKPPSCSLLTGHSFTIHQGYNNNNNNDRLTAFDPGQPG